MLRDGYIRSHRLFQLMVESGWKVNVDYGFRREDHGKMVRLSSRSELLVYTSHTIEPKDVSASIMMVVVLIV